MYKPFIFFLSLILLSAHCLGQGTNKGLIQDSTYAFQLHLGKNWQVNQIAPGEYLILSTDNQIEGKLFAIDFGEKKPPQLDVFSESGSQIWGELPTEVKTEKVDGFIMKDYAAGDGGYRIRTYYSVFQQYGYAALFMTKEKSQLERTNIFTQAMETGFKRKSEFEKYLILWTKMVGFWLVGTLLTKRIFLPIFSLKRIRQWKREITLQSKEVGPDKEAEEINFEDAKIGLRKEAIIQALIMTGFILLTTLLVLTGFVYVGWPMIICMIGSLIAGNYFVSEKDQQKNMERIMSGVAAKVGRLGLSAIIQRSLFHNRSNLVAVSAGVIGISQLSDLTDGIDLNIFDLID